MVIFGIFSVYLAFKVLNKPGISGSARTLILKRHVSSMTIFFICNLYIVMFAIIDIHKINRINKITHPWWQDFLKILFLSQGIVGPLVRLNEPAFRTLATKTIKSDIRYLIFRKEHSYEE
jgi:hypothetical protein